VIAGSGAIWMGRLRVQAGDARVAAFRLLGEIVMIRGTNTDDMAKVENRSIQYEGAHCKLAITKPSARVIVLRISGNDVGEFGEAPMQALSEWLDGMASVEIFIDARAVRGASIDVSGEWAKWLEKNRDRLSAVTMLTGSRFVQITAEFVRSFAKLEGIMRICTEPEVFERALGEATSWV
jgi:hypothetical protein